MALIYPTMTLVFQCFQGPNTSSALVFGRVKSRMIHLIFLLAGLLNRKYIIRYNILGYYGNVIGKSAAKICQTYISKLQHRNHHSSISPSIWVFPKMVVPPNHPLKNRVFHYFHHPFWGTTYFRNPHLHYIHQSIPRKSHS